MRLLELKPETDAEQLLLARKSLSMQCILLERHELKNQSNLSKIVVDKKEK